MGKGGISHEVQPGCPQDPADNTPQLLSPLQMGPMFSLSHRVVLAPVTRCRAIDNIPQACHVKFYSQRTTKGGLLISEANAVSPQAIGFPHSPGIFIEEQVMAWKKVVDAVHAKGGVIFCQLWHVGRASHTVYQPNGEAPISSTAKAISDEWSILMPGGSKSTYSPPRALSVSEIVAVVEEFRKAARNAMCAGFDGVEIHAAHGYLIDQFLKDGVNDRVDDYGGSLQNRCRFAMEVLDAVVGEIGAERTAIRVSPVIHHMGATDSDPLSLTSHLIGLLNSHPLAYLHMTEPRFTREGLKDDGAEGEMMTAAMWKMVKEEYKGRLMRSGGYSRETAMEAVSNGSADMISFGRLFISNPDLPLRFAIEAKLSKYDRSTFYTHDQVVGYSDYPFYIHTSPASNSKFDEHVDFRAEVESS
ncbi:12-oxophytodienoate reductase 7 [Cryptomeria japonica]|uniref:12-oxophytodienoate reductase 7 n=1 Tax=Cryptomeria japonica TaxID=3369 RepID=UPI0025AD0CAA|nr:12-oxophytodienoate reductase 7 [Cryptomeria japonica]